MGETRGVGDGGDLAWDAATPLSTEAAIDLLEQGELDVEGRLVEASNLTLLCTLRSPGIVAGSRGAPASGNAPSSAADVRAIYKPIRGERPLHDFPDGTLAGRERAAWLVSEASGWRVVPPTVVRDGPLGMGMVQLWIDVDPAVDVLELILTRDPRLRAMALFDVVANNADRKGGHVLPTAGGEVHGCDHGICFAAEPKLRTLLWGWAGEALTEAELEALARLAEGLAGELGKQLTGLLEPEETNALARRVEGLLDEERFPQPERGRRIIPWPPF